MDRREFVSLNLIDMDVSELERRVELAAASVAQASAPWLCSTFYTCGETPIIKT